MAKNLNIGCGASPTVGWINIDNSPSVIIGGSNILYFLAKFFLRSGSSQLRYIEFCKSNMVEYSSAHRLKFDDGSIDNIYTSHMVEHLTSRKIDLFLKEVKRVLKPGGVIRIAVPDLNLLVDRYISDHNADLFIDSLYMSTRSMDGFLDRLKYLILGPRHHQWMYDQNSMINLLSSYGFVNVQSYSKGDSSIQEPGNLNLTEREDVSLYVEAMKE